MVKYSCTRCLKEFTQKSHYNQHQKRKTPCQDNKSKMENQIEALVQEQLKQPKKIVKIRRKNIKIKKKPMERIIVVNNDCMEELAKLDDNRIDCVITDPPYFIDKLDNKWSAGDIKDDKKNSHIKHLPKGMKFDKKQVKSLYDYYLALSRVLFAKMKPGAYFLSFSSPRLYHAIAMAVELAGFEIRDMIFHNHFIHYT